VEKLGRSIFYLAPAFGILYFNSFAKSLDKLFYHICRRPALRQMDLQEKGQTAAVSIFPIIYIKKDTLKFKFWGRRW